MNRDTIRESFFALFLMHFTLKNEVTEIMTKEGVWRHALCCIIFTPTLFMDDAPVFFVGVQWYCVIAFSTCYVIRFFAEKETK